MIFFTFVNIIATSNIVIETNAAGISQISNQGCGLFAKYIKNAELR